MSELQLFEPPESVPVGSAFFYGQAPGRDASDPTTPFKGDRSGALLAHLSGIDEVDLHTLFVFHNVLHYWPGYDGRRDKFPMREARRRARELRLAWHSGDVVLFAGRRVAQAFSFTERRYLTWAVTPEGASAAIFPHPSGRNRWWNSEMNAVASARFLREAIKLVREQR